MINGPKHGKYWFSCLFFYNFTTMVTTGRKTVISEFLGTFIIRSIWFCAQSWFIFWEYTQSLQKEGLGCSTPLICLHCSKGLPIKTDLQIVLVFLVRWVTYKLAVLSQLIIIIELTFNCVLIISHLTLSLSFNIFHFLKTIKKYYDISFVYVFLCFCFCFCFFCWLN